MAISVSPQPGELPQFNDAALVAAPKPVDRVSGAIPGTPPAADSESYIDTIAVADFLASTFAQLRAKSETGKKSVGRANASALGEFPEAVAAFETHERIRRAYLERFGQLTGGIDHNHRAAGNAVDMYGELESQGRKRFVTGYPTVHPNEQGV